MSFILNNRLHISGVKQTSVEGFLTSIFFALKRVVEFQWLTKTCPFSFSLFPHANLDLSHWKGSVDCGRRYSLRIRIRQTQRFFYYWIKKLPYQQRFPQLHQPDLKEKKNKNDFAFRVVTSANVVCSVSEFSDMLKCHTGLTVNFDIICWFLMRFGRSLSSTATFQWTRRVWKPILKTSYNIKQSNTTSETTVT